MIRKMMPWAVMAVLVSCLALPVVAAQGTESEESAPKTQPGPGITRDLTRSSAGRNWIRTMTGGFPARSGSATSQAFDRMDADKDGFLTKDELRSAAREFRGKHRSRLREMDADADGNISRSEWKGKEEIFNRLDANNDGLLSSR